MSIRTVKDLIAELEGYDPEAPVRIASIGYRSAFDHSISGVASDFDDNSNEVVYIGEGSQMGYLPGSVRDELG